MFAFKKKTTTQTQHVQTAHQRATTDSYCWQPALVGRIIFYILVSSLKSHDKNTARRIFV